MFAASLACVQATLMVSNPRRSFVTRQFAIEYGMRFELLAPAPRASACRFPSAAPAITSAPQCCASWAIPGR
jgi:hypothetical protein